MRVTQNSLQQNTNNNDVLEKYSSSIIVIVHEGNDIATWNSAMSALAQEQVNTKVIIVDPTKGETGNLAHWINNPQKLHPQASKVYKNIQARLSIAPTSVNFYKLTKSQGVLLMEDIEPCASAKIYYVKTKKQKSISEAINIGVLTGRKVLDTQNFIILKAGCFLGNLAAMRLAERLQDSQIGFCGGTILDGENNFQPLVLAGVQLGPLNGKKLCKGTNKQQFPPRMHLERSLNHPIDYVVAFRLDYLSGNNSFDKNMLGHYIYADLARTKKTANKCGWADKAICYNFKTLNKFLLPAKMQHLITDNTSMLAHEVKGKISFTKKWTPARAVFVKINEYGKMFLDFLSGNTARAKARFVSIN